jgi:hypothetical protein
MKEMAPGVYEVASDSDYSKTYIVNMTGPFGQCTCTNYAIQKNRQKAKGLPPLDCKHIRSIRNMNPTAFKAQKAAQEAAAEKIRLEAEAEKQAQANKMKAELLKMRNELAGKPTLAKAVEVAKAVTKANIDPGAADDLIAEAQNVPVIPDKAPKRQSTPTDLMAQLEAAIEAQKGT